MNLPCPPVKGGRELASWGVLLFLLPLLVLAADIPPLKARVTDLTGTLSAQQRDALEQTLAEFEKRKGAQLAVLMVPTTQPETIEQYAVRVEEAWKLGRKGVDDSVILVVAKDDRRVKIEVGYGLEGVLPDAIAKRIIEDDIVPRFKQDDFYGGIRAGMDRMMRVVEGEKLPPPAVRSHPMAEGFNADWIVPALVIAVVLGGVVRAIFGRFLGSTIVGGIVGFAGWAFLGSLIVGLIAGFAAFMVTLVTQGTSGRWSRWDSLGAPWGGGGWGGGGWGGGGGGFSGGGGGSGGGGASGSW